MVVTRTGRKTGGSASTTARTQKAKKEEPGGNTSIEVDEKKESPGNRKDRRDHLPEPKRHKVTQQEETKDRYHILETGNILFFFRARVGIDHPTSAADIARTFLVLQPDSSKGHKNSGGQSGKSETDCRLITLPKKKLPRAGRDRYMAIVLNACVSGDELHSFLGDGSKDDGGEKDRGQVPVAFGEGVYALVSTAGGRESHLVYSLTVPSEPGQVQNELGLDATRGCMIVSAKNPEFPMPGGAKMAHGGPQYPDDLRAAFRGRRWAPLQPEHLEYDNTHLLLIGESHGADKIFVEAGVSEELEELADADLDRMRRLGSTDAEAVFASLGVGHVQPQQELVETFD